MTKLEPVPVKRPNHLVRNPCQCLMRIENPGELSVVTWLSGIILHLKREKCTCGSVSMWPRNLQMDTSGPKVDKWETLMEAVCWSCCRDAGYQFWDVCTHCEQTLNERGATRKGT